MSSFNGVAVYEILPNGCLNGVYTNDHPDTSNEMFNEIARRKPVAEKEILAYPNDILGLYACSYIDLGNIVCECDLEIRIGRVRRNGRSGLYDLFWFETGTNNLIFEGTGWRTRQNQITVSYRDI